MTKFEKQCTAVSEKLDISCYFPWEDSDMKLDAYEDDECLHIHKRGVHVCFGVGGDDYTGKQQNERTRAVLEALKLSRLMNQRVWVDESCEEDESCPHCGR